VNDRLVAHLRAWLGDWPPPPGRVVVVGSEARTAPGWDGRVRDVLGVARGAADGDGAVISVPPAAAFAVGDVGPEATVESVGPLVAAAVGRPRAPMFAGAFRWCEEPAAFEDAGVWVDRLDPRVPEWLRPFNGGVLLALEDGRYAAGVGIKGHDRFGHELSVGTEPSAQGRGLARRLVAQAARRVLAEGAVPTYLHAMDNVASAKVAEAAGFPDRGWRVLGLPGSE